MQSCKGILKSQSFHLARLHVYLDTLRIDKMLNLKQSWSNIPAVHEESQPVSDIKN